MTGVATTVSSQNAANAVAVVNAQEVNEVPAPTMENSIQGKVPGAVIQSNNGGAPGGGMQIQVRGITSINGNASPLYVIDGVIVDNETVEPRQQRDQQAGGGTTSTAAGSAAPSAAGQRREPHRRHQPGRHREHRGPEGRVGVGDLRLQGIGRRGHHHDQARHDRQAEVGLSAAGRPFLALENAYPIRTVPDAGAVRRPGT